MPIKIILQIKVEWRRTKYEFSTNPRTSEIIVLESYSEVDEIKLIFPSTVRKIRSEPSKIGYTFTKYCF